MPYRPNDESWDNWQLAFIRDVSYGLRDTCEPVLSFTAITLHGGALQAFRGMDIHNFIVANEVIDIKHLEGKPLIVGVEKGMMYTVKLHR
jgi:hypothetical protein